MSDLNNKNVFFCCLRGMLNNPSQLWRLEVEIKVSAWLAPSESYGERIDQWAFTHQGTFVNAWNNFIVATVWEGANGIQ